MNANYYDALGHRMAPRETKRQKKERIGLGVHFNTTTPRRVKWTKKLKAPKKIFEPLPGQAKSSKKRGFFQNIVTFFLKVVSFFKGGRA